MIRNYDIEEDSMSQVASEPPAVYGAATEATPKTRRVVTDEELARCMTLEESERLITEKIYRFYHPNA